MLSTEISIQSMQGRRLQQCNLLPCGKTCEKISFGGAMMATVGLSLSLGTPFVGLSSKEGSVSKARLTLQMLLSGRCGTWHLIEIQSGVLG